MLEVHFDFSFLATSLIHSQANRCQGKLLPDDLQRCRQDQELAVNWDMAVGQNLRYLFGDDYPLWSFYFEGLLGFH